jgi:hypothetical protein
MTTEPDGVYTAQPAKDDTIKVATISVFIDSLC